jgi:hypothetical protein
VVARRHTYRYRGRAEPRVHYTCGSRWNSSRRGAPCAFPYFRHDRLDQAVWDAVVRVATDPGVVERVVAALQRDGGPALDAAERRLRQLAQQQRTVETQIRRVLDLAADGSAPADLLREKLRELEDRRRQLAADQRAAEADCRRLAARTPAVADPARIRRFLGALLAGDALPLARRRAILFAVVGSRGITVQPDGTLQMTLRIPVEALAHPDAFIVKTEEASYPPAPR